jgi:threonylcarbamoyladenosine tRNA methylthiotransferase MtaB
MNGLRIAVTTIGCKVNQYDSQAILELFLNEGFSTVDFDAFADVYIISTCTVTAVADKKSRQMINRARRLNENAVVCAVGCLSQKDGEKLKEKCDVDIIVGNSDRAKIVSFVLSMINDKQANTYVSKIREQSRFEELKLTKPTDKTRAFIKIQEGCNNFCSYCIIPYVRGKARSRDQKNIISEVSDLVSKGISEIVLTGIHVSSYGLDFNENITLLSLITLLDKIEGLKRLRIGSLEPMLIDQEFCEEASKIKSLCPHFHLSLQSGCESVLNRMNRKYTPEKYFKRVSLLNKYFDLPAITTDIIAGFPGESDTEFNETYEFIEKVGFSKVHVFPYSIRSGTKASTMGNQVLASVKKERVNKLMNLDNSMQQQYFEKFIGKKVSVLFENDDENKKGNKVGYTKRYIKVSAKAKKNEIKDIVIQKISNLVAYES